MKVQAVVLDLQQCYYSYTAKSSEQIVYCQIYCTDMVCNHILPYRNICHGSDGVESAKKEIGLWFSDAELQDWTSCEVDWVYEQTYLYTQDISCLKLLRTHIFSTLCEQFPRPKMQTNL